MTIFYYQNAYGDHAPRIDGRPQCFWMDAKIPNAQAATIRFECVIHDTVESQFNFFEEYGKSVIKTAYNDKTGL